MNIRKDLPMKPFFLTTLIFLTTFAFAENSTKRMSLNSLTGFIRTLRTPTLVEINPGPIVMISNAKAIQTISIKEVVNRLHVAQQICEPSLPLEFPDGSQGVIICWLKKSPTATRRPKSPQSSS